MKEKQPSPETKKLLVQFMKATSLPRIIEQLAKEESNKKIS